MRRVLLTSSVFLLSFCSFAQLLIRNTTLVDVEAKKLRPGQDVLIVDGRITGVGKNLKLPENGVTVDGSGKFLMPGLVDAHIHFFQSGGLYARPDAVDLRKYQPYEKEISWTHSNMEGLLRRYLRAGITTVVDVGANEHFLKQRDSFRNKPYAPAIYMTGPLLTTYEPELYQNLGAEEPFSLMKTVEEARALVRRQLPLKPDFIKIWYIASGKNTDSIARAYLPLVKAVIEEAHAHGLRVAVHATENSTARLAVEAGADFLVHGVEDGPIDPALVQLIRSRGTVLAPTLWVAGNYSRSLGQTYSASSEDRKYAHPTPLNSLMDLPYLDSNLARRLRSYFSMPATQARDRREDSLRAANLLALHRAGAFIATGTDAGNTGTQHVSSYFDELRAMQAAGMDTWSLLQASTIQGARSMGKEKEFGAIRKGMVADLLLLRQDPTTGIEAWKSIERVINKGVVVEPDSLVRMAPEELADLQLLGYNLHDIETFVSAYSEDVEIYELNTNKLLLKGKKAMREQYGEFFRRVPELHCTLINRMIEGNFVIDHEEITRAGGRKNYGVAIYEVEAGKIRKVWFP